MKNLKKIVSNVLITVLIAAMALTLASCGKNGETTTTPNAENAQTEVNEKSFTFIAVDGDGKCGDRNALDFFSDRAGGLGSRRILLSGIGNVLLSGSRGIFFGIFGGAGGKAQKHERCQQQG